MRKKYEFDERQLLLRGNVFQHTTVLLFVLLFANGVLSTSYETLRKKTAARIGFMDWKEYLA